MGKGRILSAAGDGLYTIEIIEDRARAESARASAVTRVSDLTDRIATLEQEVAALQSAVDQAVSAQDTAINLYQQEMAADGASKVDLAGPAQAVVQAAAERDKVRGQIAQLQLEKLGLEATIARIDALPPLRQVQAWCADYTEDLAGEVATAEVPGEVGQVVIKPGFSDSAAWSASADGAIQPALSGTPAGVFYNLAMMPGWQKWRPTFRIATISNINNDLCDIALIPAKSSQQNLNVNMASAYDGVPIMYMDCNGDAFEDGDRVLVAFSGNTGAPMVVGFEKEPRECFVPFEYSTAVFNRRDYVYTLPSAIITGQVWTSFGSVTCTPISELDATPIPVEESDNVRPIYVSDGLAYSIDYRNNVDGSESGIIEPSQEPTQQHQASDIAYSRALSWAIDGVYVSNALNITEKVVLSGLSLPGISATELEVEVVHTRTMEMTLNRTVVEDYDTTICGDGPLYRMNQDPSIDYGHTTKITLTVPGFSPLIFETTSGNTRFSMLWVGFSVARRGVAYITVLSNLPNVRGLYILHAGGVTKAAYNSQRWQHPQTPSEVSMYSFNQTGTGLPVDVNLTQQGFEYLYE